MPRKITVSHERKPIPTDQFDFMASFDDDAPDEDGLMLVGFGATCEDAIDDLLDRAGIERPFQITQKSWAH